MRERTQAVAFLAAWAIALIVVWAAVAATSPGPPPTAPSPIAVHLEVRGPSWTIAYDANTRNHTVFLLLREANATLGFEIDWVEYGWPYHDVLITSINGSRRDGAAGLYWQYCLNGAYATRGAMQQTLVGGDAVRWVYAPAGGSELCR